MALTGGAGLRLGAGLGGALIGSFFGMPGLGFAIGSALVRPEQKSEKPDPGDLSFDYSAYGKFRPWGYGVHPVEGITIWSRPGRRPCPPPLRA